MALHLLKMGGITTLIVFGVFYPFLPGDYDGSSLVLSAMAQAFGVVGLLFVPIGGLWLGYEWRKRARRQRQLPTTALGYYFALLTLLACVLVALVVSLGAFIGLGLAFGLATLALWATLIWSFVPSLRALKTNEAENFNPAPLYLTFIPLIVFSFQLMLSAPAAEFSRNYAITQSAALIHDIEQYHAAHGRYPSSLLALWPDYRPGVVGIPQYHYIPSGAAYSLYFKQPPLLIGGFGTEEIVMYNQLDEHIMVSHAAWLLMWSPVSLEARQGWYAVHDAPSPHWKYFWFD